MAKIKSTIVGGLMLALSGGAALADGMPRAAMTAPMAPNWSGLYVGGGLGYGAWTADTTTVSPTTGVCILCVAQTQGGEGFFGTLSIGYDHQINPLFVVGVFFDASFGNIEGKIQDQGPFFVGTTKEDRMFAVGGRLGTLLNPAVLAYGTAGYTNAHFTGATMVSAFNGAATGFSTSDSTRDGWFIGSGIEAMIQKGWYWRLEYRYADYGKATLADRNAAGVPAASITFEPIEQTVRSELVYKFR